MKNKTNTRRNTRINDITKNLEAACTEASANARKNEVQAQLAVDLDGYGDPPDYRERIKECRTLIATKNEARSAWKRVPAARRKWADEAIKNAVECADRAIAQTGEQYSGQVSTKIEWRSTACAWTYTSAGDRYSRSCKYTRTNATHIVHLDARRVMCLLDRPDVVQASRRDGLPLIALDPDGACVWVNTRGKQIKSVNGWIACRQGVTYHSIVSREHAEQGLARKWKKQSEQIKANRRARLISRLCKGVVATVEDALAMGYCVPGIRQFRERHGIGATATLSKLVQTGDPQAVALAFSIARKVSR